ncbi:2-amino-4-hydroxy-6-hydroxymethyldihydropteridine diphosphokinase [Ectobacillus ponti]|uniref:2-amino-4-hydroxy-6-hydroxymethyldihydropteridine diphosphokinase n=1 Tax=Ectobacillus ponti TaxID=2961894 RepID=A0AA42BS96_9BACI|nr:2-amino-4-hydroxy-6-hydroxymethyldihydropteridine diphosphokinase [Ectobacillus ponti]MCP8971156.1 2-amino-4-hydroxy-6-hydroxymethyldihydropteridine diphosphokinase [Ectobacillus ponti]
MRNTAYLALGSNIGDRAAFLSEAVSSLRGHPDIQVEALSSIYETDPVGYTEQDKFLNMAVKVSTSLSPGELLAYIQETERQLGRKREIHWGPRTIDLDILLFNHENIVAENLIIPHPRMHERAFVLVPLLEINAEMKSEISDIQLDDMKRREGVTVWKRKNGEDGFALFGS